MAKWTGKRIIELTLFKQINTALIGKVGYEHVFFWCLYIISLYFCATTIGDQYLEALTKAEEQNINIFDDSEQLRNSALNFLSGDVSADSATVPSFRVPSKWLPGFWASISFGVVCILHILMVLGQKWSVWFRCLIRFRKVASVSEATHVAITPQKHQGKQELVEIQKFGNSSYVMFHRRKYVYDSKSDTFIKVRCRVNYPMSHFVRWKGIPSDEVCKTLSDLHGPNKFQMASPTFMDLYITQITSPFTVFQVFCVFLWMLDSYWQYSMFTLFMICSFEATTVFTRLKSLATLKGMGNEPRPIYVYRLGLWKTVSTEELLPGDLFSLTKYAKDDVIPCDALIVRGGAVVNEASLTGESVPQMKDGICPAVDESALHTEISIKGAHKVHALFGGTRVLQVTSVSARSAELEEDQADAEEAEELSQAKYREAGGEGEEKEGSKEEVEEEDEAEGLKIKEGADMGDMEVPPDGGCLCYCTRTGFSSSQGKLVRMIENSQSSVGGDTRDTALLLLFLLVFALTASGYVLYKGMEEGRQSKYQLLLQCILIITSVIPPELPMQTALAVNASLMTLMKMQIFCTEPFRVPIAGKVDTCVFDKTGTLTTDELVAVGVVPPSVRVRDLRKQHDEAIAKLEKLSKEKQAAAEHPTLGAVPAAGPGGVPAPLGVTPNTDVSVVSAATAGMTPISQASAEMMLVLGACHSVVLVDGKPAGDPLEVASLRAIRWEIAPKAQDTARPKPELAVERTLKVSTLDSGDVSITQVKILARHHFNSKLQRMSVVARIKGDNGGSWSVVKGSPEALAQMCLDCPEDFTQVAGDLAKRGMRVIALGLRRLTGSTEIQSCCESRAACEENLRFVGFVAFTCRVRKDSAVCVQNLRAGGNAVIMATGDAMLTAVHVAQEVGITTSAKKGILILEEQGLTQGALKWTDYASGEDSRIPFRVTDLSKLCLDYDLCVTGFTLSKALEAHVDLAQHLEQFVVYARMRPDEKERVILAMKNNGRVCLMCGDGANVSLAL